MQWIDNREVMEDKLQDDKRAFAMGTMELRANPYLIKIALAQTHLNWNYVEGKKNFNEDFLLELLNINAYLYLMLDETHRANEKLAYFALSQNRENAQYLPYALALNESFIHKIVKKNVFVLPYLLPVFKKDLKLAQYALSTDPTHYKWFDKDIRQDLEIIKIVFKHKNKNKKLLAYVPDFLHENEEVCILALKSDPSNFEYINKKLFLNKAFVLEILQLVPERFQVLPETMKADNDIAKCAIEKEPLNYRYVDKNIKNRAEIILLALQTEKLKGVASDKNTVYSHLGKDIQLAIGQHDPVEYYERKVLANKLKENLPEKKDHPSRLKI